MNEKNAIAVAQDAIIWLSHDPDTLGTFLSASGAAPGDLAGLLGDPGFLGFLLDFVLGDDARVIAFAAAAGLRPEDVARARAALPGGAVPDWT